MVTETITAMLSIMSLSLRKVFKVLKKIFWYHVYTVQENATVRPGERGHACVQTYKHMRDLHYFVYPTTFSIIFQLQK